MVIVNMIKWWWGGANLWAPTDLYAAISWTTASITRKDPDLIWTIPPTWFSKSVLVRKVGSAPTSPTDWTVVVEETIRNTYETTPYEDTWLTRLADYHYRVFTISTTWGISYSDSVNPSWFKTYTISWEEKSNMSSWWTYSDNAEWLTAWDTAFDEFFWYSAVRLNTSWVETAEITQAQSWWAWKLDITQLWTLTSWDNVMIKFPVRWIKMSKSWSIVTLSITDWLGRENEWYQYYAHSIGTLSNPWTPKDAFYLWAYKWCNSSNVLKSWSWTGYAVSSTPTNLSSYAKANGSWYNIIGFYQRMYINALYMMKYWNPDSQTTIWMWITNAKNAWTSWSTNSQTDASYWTTSNTTACKLFGLENRWWCLEEIIGWVYLSWGALTVKLSWWDWNNSWWDATWDYVSIWNSIWNEISSISGTSSWMFMPASVVNAGNNMNTYYCDEFYYVGDWLTLFAWGSYIDNLSSNGRSSWIFWWQFRPQPNYAWIWTRLMYMNWLT